MVVVLMISLLHLVMLKDVQKMLVICVYIKTAQEIITKLTGKHLFFIKLQFYSFQPDSKGECDTDVFFCEIGKSFQSNFSTEQLLVNIVFS